MYEQAADTYGSSLDRLARAYELDPEARRDLVQDIHLHLWRSFAYFDLRCSLRTWVNRVAHKRSHRARDSAASAQGQAGKGPRTKKMYISSYGSSYHGAITNSSSLHEKRLA